MYRSRGLTRDKTGSDLFNITLHRLRKLLGHHTAIQMTDRRAGVNREMVWVDLWALERERGSVVALGQAWVATAEALERTAPAILDLYRGHFLPGEADSSWLLPVRNRLSGRFHRFVMRLGDHWEAAAEWSRCGTLRARHRNRAAGGGILLSLDGLPARTRPPRRGDGRIQAPAADGFGDAGRQAGDGH